MIQDIYPKKFDNQYVPVRPKSFSLLVIVRGDTLLIRQEADGITFPRFCDLSGCEGNTVYLFSINEQAYFTVLDLGNITDGIARLEHLGYSFTELSFLRCSFPKWMCFAGATAYQLINWYRKNRYCGRCGEKLEHDPAERMLQCRYCGNHVYPQICPAVVVGIVHQEKILMTKYSDQRDGTRYALIAGFAEVGETLEETVRREVMEEVGLKVKNISYYKSQPWSFSDTLLLGFFCELDGSDMITMDTRELSTAEWVSREDMEIKDDGISLTYEMMSVFKENGKEAF